VTTINRADLDRRIRKLLQTWREELFGGVPSARRLLRKILAGPLTPTDASISLTGRRWSDRSLAGWCDLDLHLFWRARGTVHWLVA